MADEAPEADDLSAASLSSYERQWRLAFDLDLRALDPIVAMVRNRVLLPLWAAHHQDGRRAFVVDPEYALRCGGILAGVVPSYHGMSPQLTVKTLLQRPGFWLRNRGEVGQALKALLTPDLTKTSATGRVRAGEYAIGWALDVVTKTWAVSQ